MAPLPVTLTDLQSVSFVAHFPYLASHNMCSYEQTLLVAAINSLCNFNVLYTSFISE